MVSSLTREASAIISGTLAVLLLMPMLGLFSAYGEASGFQMIYDATARKNGGDKIAVFIHLSGPGKDFTGTVRVTFLTGELAGETYVPQVEGSYRQHNDKSGDDLTIRARSVKGSEMSIRFVIVGAFCEPDEDGNNFEVNLDKSWLNIDPDTRPNGSYEFLPNPGPDAHVKLP